MKNKIFLWSFRIIFLLSLFAMFFSIFKIYESKSAVNSTLQEWEGKQETTVVDSLISSSISLNKQPTKLESVNSEAINVESIQPLYTTMPDKGEVFGKLSIPKIKKEFPIIEGTDQEELANGVGHYTGSVLPGEADNTVLAGHRDTVFGELGKVEVGDIVEVETEGGHFKYKITKQRIVHKDDRTVIVPYDYAAITLITCYPFNFVGAAPERFILVGELVED